MSAEWTPRPYVVGEENVLVVGVQGVVESVSPESITIAGHVLPRAMDGTGVRYLSMIWPEPACERAHCTDGGDDAAPASDSEASVDLEALTALIRTEHETRHASEAMRFCNDPICREVFAIEVTL